jgi:hypothetical protein
VAHDATKVVLGSTGSSDRDVTAEPADPATFVAGLAVRRNSDGGLQIAADGNAVLIGVSLGVSLSDTKKTAVARDGAWIPLLLINDAATVKIGNITFTAIPFGTLGNVITIELVDGATGGEATVTTDVETPANIVVEIEDGVTTAQAIADAISADDGQGGAAEYVFVSIDSGEEETEQDAHSQAALTGGTDFAFEGATVKIDATTGKGSVDGTATGAAYLSGVKTGIYPDGTTAPCAFIAMPGGF